MITVNVTNIPIKVEKHKKVQSIKDVVQLYYKCLSKIRQK
jgi:hypothetical protein